MDGHLVRPKPERAVWGACGRAACGRWQSSTRARTQVRIGAQSTKHALPRAHKHTGMCLVPHRRPAQHSRSAANLQTIYNFQPAAPLPPRPHGPLAESSSDPTDQRTRDVSAQVGCVWTVGCRVGVCGRVCMAGKRHCFATGPRGMPCDVLQRDRVTCRDG